MSAIITVTGFVVLARILRRLAVGSVTTAFILAGLFLVRVDLFLSMMESALAFLMIGAALTVSLKTPESPEHRSRRRVILGLILGALFLARLDTVFIVAGLALGTAYAWGERSPRAWLSHQITIGMAFAAVVFPYLLWNLIKFGHIIPVSGAKKMRATETSLDSIFRPNALLALPEAIIGKLPGPETAWWLIGALGATVVGLILIWTHRRRVCGGGDHPLSLPRGHTSGEGSPPWYLVPDYFLYGLLSAIGISLALRVAPKKFTVPGRAMIPALAMLLLVGTLNIRRDAQLSMNENEILLETGRWARENLPADTLVGMYDSGYFSYFSELATVSLNGLATDFDTMEQLSEGDLSGVIRRLGIDYYVVIRPGDGGARVPPGKLAYTSRTFPSSSNYSGGNIFVIGPLNDDVDELLAYP